MKVNGSRGVASPGVAKAGRARRAPQEAFELEAAPAVERGPVAVSGANTLAAAESIIAIQGADDGAHRRRKAVYRAEELLDLLNEIKVGLLEGAVPSGRLNALVQVITSKRGEVSDPNLSNILNEIDLRARVELAKLGHIT